MPLFMDVHKNVEGLTVHAVADAHKEDMAVHLEAHGLAADEVIEVKEGT